MALACDICQQVIPWREMFGERFQPHGNVHYTSKSGLKVKYTHCFNHSIEEVNKFILESRQK